MPPCSISPTTSCRRRLRSIMCWPTCAPGPGWRPAACSGRRRAGASSMAWFGLPPCIRSPRCRAWGNPGGPWPSEASICRCRRISAIPCMWPVDACPLQRWLGRAGTIGADRAFRRSCPTPFTHAIQRRPTRPRRHPVQQRRTLGGCVTQHLGQCGGEHGAQCHPDRGGGFDPFPGAGGRRHPLAVRPGVGRRGAVCQPPQPEGSRRRPPLWPPAFRDRRFAGARPDSAGRGRRHAVGGGAQAAKPRFGAPGARRALWVAGAALVSKELLFRYMLMIAKRVKSSLLVANAWHARSDAASSLVVGAGIAGNLAGFPLLDPIAALIVGLMVGRMGWRFAWDALHDLMDRAVDEEEVAAIRQTLVETPGVIGVHDVRTRRMGDMIVVDAHIEVDARLTVEAGHDIAVAAQHRVMARHRVLNLMTHVDPWKRPDLDHQLPAQTGSVG